MSRCGFVWGHSGFVGKGPAWNGLLGQAVPPEQGRDRARLLPAALRRCLLACLLADLRFIASLEAQKGRTAPV